MYIFNIQLPYHLPCHRSHFQGLLFLYLILLTWIINYSLMNRLHPLAYKHILYLILKETLVPWPRPLPTLSLFLCFPMPKTFLKDIFVVVISSQLQSTPARLVSKIPLRLVLSRSPASSLLINATEKTQMTSLSLFLWHLQSTHSTFW